ncbi:MAG: hypothetical protein CBC13_01485 [Planctomycetia bacterium TMED53]|nr:MAG: hypothetical protein CBC13_01485 [Planctomycetia bacterium TMED53]
MVEVNETGPERPLSSAWFRWVERQGKAQFRASSTVFTRLPAFGANRRGLSFPRPKRLFFCS